MSDAHWTSELQKLSACAAAVTWASAYPTIQAAWDACERGDWMLWFCGHHAGKPWSDGRRPLVLCVCEWARIKLKFVWAREDHIRLLIECVEAWARGEHDDHEKLKNATVAAYDGTCGTDESAADIYSVAAAAYAYDYAAGAYYDARKTTLKLRADIVRRYYPNPPLRRRRHE